MRVATESSGAESSDLVSCSSVTDSMRKVRGLEHKQYQVNQILKFFYGSRAPIMWVIFRDALKVPRITFDISRAVYM